MLTVALLAMGVLAVAIISSNARLDSETDLQDDTYFLYVNRPEPGVNGPIVLKGVGAQKVFVNSSNIIEISNSVLSSIDLPCPQAQACYCLISRFTARSRSARRPW